MTATDERVRGIGIEPDAASAGENPVAASLTCVFAVCERQDSSVLGASQGHPDAAPPYMLALDDGAAGRLWALAQEVPAAQFGEEALHRRMADRAALESGARAHHAMITAAAAVGTIVPLPFATLFTDRDRARAALCERLPEFRAVLDRLRGRVEWGVKVYAASQVEQPRPADPPGAITAAPGSGRAYLDRVRSRKLERESRLETVLAGAARIDEMFAGLSAAAVRRRPHGPEFVGRGRTQILNAAYLVDESRTDELYAALSALHVNSDGRTHIELSGPWVPYSFAGSEET